MVTLNRPRFGCVRQLFLLLLVVLSGCGRGSAEESVKIPNPFSKPASPSPFEIFDSYAAAAQAAKGFDYDEPHLAKERIAVALKWKSPGFHPACHSWDLALIAGASKVKPPLKVLDFGGASGLQYYTLTRQGRVEVEDYCVVETAAQVKVANETGLGDGTLRFVDNLASVKGDGFNVVYSSGTLQCVPEPYKTLQELVDLDAPVLILARLGFVDRDTDLYSVYTAKTEAHLGPLAGKPTENRVTKTPLTYMSRKRFDEIVGKKYEIIMETPDESGSHSNVNGIKVFGGHVVCLRKGGVK